VTGNKIIDIGGVNLEMAYVQSGFFNREHKHIVQPISINKPFYIGIYQVTQEQWKCVMGNNPSDFIGDRNPVEMVNWFDCQDFSKKLSERTGETFRLPTEAEFEYAARGGNQSKGFVYSGSNSIDDVAWYAENSLGHHHPVGQKQSNELGIFDMSGNVCEWCSDWWGGWDDFDVPEGCVGVWDDPSGPATGELRIFRTGAWDCLACVCTPSVRMWVQPSHSSCHSGFRVVLEPKI
jgi:formylglycine-generating enzyme required for sulfatase activity